MYIAYREVGAGALAGCSSVHVISSVHIVVGAQGLTAAASGCSRLLLAASPSTHARQCVVAKGQHVLTVKN